MLSKQGDHPVSRIQQDDRRTFLRQGAAVASASMAGVLAVQNATGVHAAEGSAKTNRLPREVWIATIAQDGMRAGSPKQMVDRMLERMRDVVSMEPDIICLPEIFPCSNLEKSAPPIAEVAEEGLGPILQAFSTFAADHACYVVCPTYTKQLGKFFNAAVFLDRKGKILGEYRKTYPTVSEMEIGVVPGPMKPPIFETDFGKVGAQICFDIEWDTGWRHLRDAGAEIVFWPSAFAGGRMVNTRAWQNRYCVVSSTNKDVSKICDITGEELAATSRWHPWVCTSVNLEKVFLHTWPYVNRFRDIANKYGAKVRITTFAFEEWSIIESRDSMLKISDILKEFELVSIDEHLATAVKKQLERRPG